jgi:hypothetical protein
VDPHGLAATDLLASGSWNLYSYVQGDPINFADPLGTSLTCDYEYNGAEGTSGEWVCSPDPDGKQTKSTSKPTPEQMRWTKALAAISAAQALVVADLAPVTVSDDCQKDIDALGVASVSVFGTNTITNASLAGAVVDADYEDGTTATANASTLNDPSINALPNIANGPISNLFGGSVKAEAQLGGNMVYLAPTWILGNSIFYDAGLLAHEALHNLGLTDPQVESALGLTGGQCPNGSTDCISTKLQSDCFQPQSIILGGGHQ